MRSLREWVCGIHPQMQTTVNPDLFGHIDTSAPISGEKDTLEQLARSSSLSYPLEVCTSCFSWIDYWSRDHHRIESARKNETANGRHEANARRMELAARYEDAAKEYEAAGLWEEAGRARSIGSTRTIKTVSVNLNELVADLRRGGLALNHECHACSASITIGSGGLDAPRVCPYCGSVLNTEMLSNLLRTALR